jgi:hypothetical protein
VIGDEFDLERPPSRNCVEVHAPRLSRGHGRQMDKGAK